jgi:hypothetical protein
MKSATYQIVNKQTSNISSLINSLVFYRLRTPLKLESGQRRQKPNFQSYLQRSSIKSLANEMHDHKELVTLT